MKRIASLYWNIMGTLGSVYAAFCVNKFHGFRQRVIFLMRGSRKDRCSLCWRSDVVGTYYKLVGQKGRRMIHYNTTLKYRRNLYWYVVTSVYRLVAVCVHWYLFVVEGRRRPTASVWSGDFVDALRRSRIRARRPTTRVTPPTHYNYPVAAVFICRTL